jgi:hypothetical protein
MRCWLLLALLCALPALAETPSAQESPTVEPQGLQARATPEQVQLGEPFTYELVITHPRDHRYELVAPKALEDFELLEQTRQRQDQGDRAVTTFGLKLSAFALGPLQLPDLTFEVATPDGPKHFIAPGRTVEVASTLPPDAQGKGASLYDYKPPTEVPVRSWRLVWILAGLVAAGLLAWALVKYLRRPRPDAALVKPLLPLDARTRQALDALRAEDLPSRGHVKDFYFRLSEILRGYLGERYGFEALECTSSELMASLRQRPTPGLPEEKLMRFISESDLVKYARAEASPEACGSALAFGYELLEKTWAPPAPPPPVTAAHAPGPRVS